MGLQDIQEIKSVYADSGLARTEFHGPPEQLKVREKLCTLRSGIQVGSQTQPQALPFECVKAFGFTFM